MSQDTRRRQPDRRHLKKGKRLKANERRAQLLSESEKIVHEGGAASLTMEQVARRAGVTIPVVYRHFDNRADLLLALLEEHWQHFDRRVRVETAHAKNYPEVVRAGIKAYFDSLEERGPVLAALLRQRTGIVAFEDRRRARRREWVRWWSQQLRTAYAIPESEAEAATVISLGATDAAGMYWLSNPSIPRQRIEDLVVKMTLSFLEARVGGVQRQWEKGSTSPIGARLTTA